MTNGQIYSEEGHESNGKIILMNEYVDQGLMCEEEKEPTVIQDLTLGDGRNPAAGNSGSGTRTRELAPEGEAGRHT